MEISESLKVLTVKSKFQVHLMSWQVVITNLRLT